VARIKHNGAPLKVNGQPAGDASCCCGCPTCATSPDTLYAQFTIGTSSVTIELSLQTQPCSDGYGEVPPYGDTLKAWYGSGTLMYGAIPVVYKILVVCICGEHYVQWQACGPDPAAVDALEICDVAYLTGLNSFGTLDGLPSTLETSAAAACLPPGITDPLEVTLST